MVTKVVVKKSTYRDSITLMKISNSIAKLSGITQAAVVMATGLNRRVLSEAGFSDAVIGRASNDDMIVAVEAKDSKSLDAALVETDKLLSTNERPAGGAELPSSLEDAIGLLPEANLAVISVPGQFAKREAARAISKGLNVFLFSSNVSRSDERELKEMASKKHLLVMGPDCGTSIINGKVLGFGNAIRPGRIGIVSASGTGLQEVSCMIHNLGLGVSHAIGTGGGDLSDEVGGMTTLQGLSLLARDPGTDVVVIISKPPGPETMRAVLNSVKKLKKPAVINFLGAQVSAKDADGQVRAETLEEAAIAAAKLGGAKVKALRRNESLPVLARREASRLSSSQRYVRGLFSGGTLCYEAQIVLQKTLGEIYSNAPLKAEFKIDGIEESRENSCIDMGADEFVVGRAHPMIDFTLRRLRILREAKDPETAVILIDVVLGLGSNPDPAGELVPTILEARRASRSAGRYLPVIAALIGTDGDFQGLKRQKKALEDARVAVCANSAEAAMLAGQIATGRKLKR